MNGQAYLKLTLAQVRLYLREPAALFFTLAFPPMLLLLFGAAFGNALDPTYQVGFVDYYTPALIALVAGTVGLMSLPVKTASDRESGVLKRFQATPLSARVYLVADLTTALGVNLIAVALTVALGFAVYHLARPQHPLAVVGATVLGALGFAGLGYLLAAFLPTARAAQAVGSVLFFPMMFLSGASIPLDLLPTWLQRLSEALPMTRMVHLLSELWLSATPQGLLPDLAWLAGMAVVGLWAASRIFRWS